MSDAKAAVDKILVCVSSSPSTAGVVRFAARKAAGTLAKLFAVYVETPRGLLLPEEERNRAIDNLRLAEQLGAETFTLAGTSVAKETMRFARERGITRIIAGK